MARNQSGGGFNKFLNFIGLVDDQQPRDNYGDEYNSNSYGRPSTYVPPRQRTGDDSRRAGANVRRNIPAQGSRSSYGGQRTYGTDDDQRYQRRDTGFGSNYNSGYSEPRSSRPRSRFEEDDEPQRAEAAQQPRQAARPATNRTVMLSLNNLRDANKVITALVKGNTIVMTLEIDDERLRERIVDTLSGAVFALDANIRKATEQTYLLAPKTVNVKSAYEVDDRF